MFKVFQSRKCSRAGAFLFLFLFLFCLLPFSILANEGFDFDEDLEEEAGFSLPLSLKLGLKNAQQISPRRAIFSGASFSPTLAYSLGDFLFHIEGDGFYNLAYRKEKDPSHIISQYEKEWVTRQAYASYVDGDKTLYLGKKIEIVGKNDILSVLDVISPRDTTEALFAGPKQARLGQNLLRFSFGLWESELSLYYSPKGASHKSPEPGHPYAPLALPRVESYTHREKEYYISLSHTFGPFDWVFMGGSPHVRDPLLVLNEGALRKEYHPYDMVGAGLTYTGFGVLFKMEASHFTDYPLMAETLEKHKGFGYALGIDYFSQQYGQFMVEAMGKRVDSYAGKSPEINTNQYAFSYQKGFMRDDLSVQFLLMGIETAANLIGTLKVQYRFMENFELAFSKSLLHIESKAYKELDDYDRYAFSLYWYLDMQKRK